MEASKGQENDIETTNEDEREDAMNAELKTILADLYAAQDLVVDKLPYTKQFDAIHAAFNKEHKRVTEKSVTKARTFQLLGNLRKAGLLEKKLRAGRFPLEKARVLN